MDVFCFGSFDTSFDGLIESVIAVLSTIHIVSDILFAVQVKQTAISCTESCECAWNEDCPLSDATCSNGVACPSDRSRLNNLYIATVFFICFHAFISVVYVGALLLFSEEQHRQLEKESCESRIRITPSKKKLTVLVNGDKKGTFYHYRISLPNSREAMLSSFSQFGSRIQILKKWTAFTDLWFLSRLLLHCNCQ